MYFHVSNMHWEIGAIIQPGEWGRKMRIMGVGPINLTMENVKTMIWESCLETARLMVDPNLPSRLNCVFLCNDREHVQRFRDRRRPGADIYTCLPVEEGVNQHLADFSILDAGDGPLIDTITPRATQYWTNEAVGIREIIHAGSVRVIGRW